MIIGFDGVMCGPNTGMEVSIAESVKSFSAGRPTGGLPFEDRERRRAGVDREAIFWKAAALSPSFMRVVRRDLRETRLGLELTRWNSGV